MVLFFQIRRNHENRAFDWRIGDNLGGILLVSKNLTFSSVLGT